MDKPVALLVEDDHRILDMVSSMLARAGFDARTFTDAKNARSALDELPDVRLFILDRGIPETPSHLPDSDAGDNLLRHIALERPHSPIAVYTGSTDRDHERFVASCDSSRRAGITVISKDQVWKLDAFVTDVARGGE